MNKTILNFRTDPETKEQIQRLAAELGVPVSVILNAQIKQILRDRKLVLSTELEPTPYLETIMRQVESDLSVEKNITRTATSAEALAHLESL